MTINESAIRLLSYFAPEEREIPDNASYPGRNAAVIGAINGALQTIFAEGGPWTRKDERGCLLYPPATITLSAIHDATALAVTDGWDSWMIGCSIIIDGHDAQNQIRYLHSAGTASVTINPAGTNNTIYLEAQYSGAAGNDISLEIAAPEYIPELVITVTGTAIVATPVKKLSVSGTLTDGTNPVVFSDMIPAEESGHLSSTGSLNIPMTGEWYGCDKSSSGPIWWELRYFLDNTLIASWESTDDVDDPADASWIPVNPATGTPVLSHVITTTAAQVVEAINTSDQASSLVTAANVGTSSGVVAVVAQTHLSGGSNLIAVKIPYGGETGTRTATVYHDCISIGNDVLEVTDPVMANGIRLVGQPAAGGPAFPSTFNDYGATVIRTPFQPMQIDITSTAQPMFYSVTTWTQDSATPDRLRMNISPAPDQHGTLTYDVLLLPPVVDDLSSTDDLPIPFKMVDSVFMPIAVMHLFDSPFLRGMTAPDAVSTKYKIAMEQLSGIDPQKKNPRFVIRG